MIGVVGLVDSFVEAEQVGTRKIARWQRVLDFLAKILEYKRGDAPNAFAVETHLGQFRRLRIDRHDAAGVDHSIAVIVESFQVGVQHLMAHEVADCTRRRPDLILLEDPFPEPDAAEPEQRDVAGFVLQNHLVAATSTVEQTVGANPPDNRDGLVHLRLVDGDNGGTIEIVPREVHQDIPDRDQVKLGQGLGFFGADAFDVLEG